MLKISPVATRCLCTSSAKSQKNFPSRYYFDSSVWQFFTILCGEVGGNVQMCKTENASSFMGNHAVMADERWCDIMVMWRYTINSILYYMHNDMMVYENKQPGDMLWLFEEWGLVWITFGTVFVFVLVFVFLLLFVFVFVLLFTFIFVSNWWQMVWSARPGVN